MSSEMLNEFRKYNLLSVYGELKFLNDQEMQKNGPWKAWVPDNDLKTLYINEKPIMPHITYADANARKLNLDEILSDKDNAERF